VIMAPDYVKFVTVIKLLRTVLMSEFANSQTKFQLTVQLGPKTCLVLGIARLLYGGINLREGEEVKGK
jgi:hypothetical protein